MKCLSLTNKGFQCRNECTFIFCSKHRGLWITGGAKIILGILAIVAQILLPICIQFFFNDRDLAPTSKIFEPIFSANDVNHFNVLILKFKDFTAEEDTNHIGESIQEQLNVAKANDSTLAKINISYGTDSIAPPKTIEDAEEIQIRHNADLVIYGRAKNVLDNYKEAEVAFRYTMDQTLQENLKNVIILRRTKHELDYQTILPDKIDLGEITVDTLAIPSWVSSLSKLKFGNKKEAYLELDAIANDIALSPRERANRLYLIANTYERKNEDTHAITALNKAMQNNVNDKRFLVGMAIILNKIGFHEKALEKINLVIDDRTIDSRVFEIRADINYHLKIYNQAIQDYTKAIKLDSARLFTRYLGRANSLAGLKNYAKALVEYESCIQLNDKKVYKAHIGMSTVHCEMGDYENGMIYINEAIRIDSLIPLSYINRGTIHLVKGNTVEAGRDFDKALEIDPYNALAYNSCGFMFLEQKDYKQSIYEFDKAISIDSTLSSAFARRGRSFMKLKMLKKAKNDLDRAIQMHTEYEPAYLWRAELHLEMGKREMAIIDCYLLYEKKSKNPETLDRLADLLMILGVLDPVPEILNTSISLDSEIPVTYYIFACYYAKIGDYEKTLENLLIAFNGGMDQQLLNEDEWLLNFRKSKKYSELLMLLK